MQDFDIRKGVLYSYCGDAAAADVPYGTKSIARRAFFECDGLKTVRIPRTVTEIHEDNFVRCYDLHSIEAAHLLPSEFNSASVIYACIGFAELLYRDVKIDEEIAKAYREYIKTHRFRLLVPACGSAALMRFLTEEKMLNIEETDFCLSGRNAPVEVRAMLMEYYTAFDEKTKELFETRGLREPTTAELKKLFSTRKLPDGTLEITSYKGSEKCVFVPEKIGRASVSAIGEDAFSPRKKGLTALDKIYRRQITDIILPDSIKTISHDAFLGCDGLVDKDGFLIAGGILLEYYGSAVDVKVPDGVERIDAAFSGLSTIKTIGLPNSLKRIGERSFLDCSSLESLLIPEGVTAIDEDAFVLCTHLKNLVLPAGLRSMGKRLFLFCYELKEITLPEEIDFIHEECFLGAEDMRLKVKKGSYAEKFALEKGMNCIYI